MIGLPVSIASVLNTELERELGVLIVLVVVYLQVSFVC